jgi:hypothetical protein
MFQTVHYMAVRFRPSQTYIPHIRHVSIADLTLNGMACQHKFIKTSKCVGNDKGKYGSINEPRSVTEVSSKRPDRESVSQPLT